MKKAFTDWVVAISIFLGACIIALSGCHYAPVGSMPLPPDIRSSGASVSIPTNVLAEGSVEALRQQESASDMTGLPIEVITAMTQIPLRLVPPGTLTLRTRPYLAADTPREYTLSIDKPFYMGKYEITQENWAQVMGTNPAHFASRGIYHPVEQVSWCDTQEFIQRLCQIEGTRPGAYRLPTRSEWEYACRAGTLDNKYAKEDPSIKGVRRYREPNDRIGWYEWNTLPNPDQFKDAEPGVFRDQGPNEDAYRRGGTHPVGLKMPNAYGLFDTLGNVAEWTQEVDTNRADRGFVMGDNWFSSTFRVSEGCAALLSERSRLIGLRIVRILNE